MTGPSRLAHLPHAVLTTVLVRLDHRIARLEAERERRLHADAVRTRPSNMAGIARFQRATVAVRKDALREVLAELTSKRMDWTSREIAPRLTKRLGVTVRPSSLYRPPYAVLWRKGAADPLDKPVDRAAGASAARRTSRRRLIQLILQREPTLAALISARREELVAESLAEEGWDPLP